MSKLNKKLYSIIAAILTVGIVGGITYAAFVDRSEVKGSTFSVGSADIKLLADLAGGVTDDNLLDTKDGPIFSNIGQNWNQDYALKVYNNSNNTVAIFTSADYITANDPDELRAVIYVEPFSWDDTNNNGAVDDGETGTSFGKKSIIKWKTEGYDLGQILPGELKGIILNFSTGAISDTKQGKTGTFDFEFNSTSL